MRSFARNLAPLLVYCCLRQNSYKFQHLVKYLKCNFFHKVTFGTWTSFCILPLYVAKCDDCISEISKDPASLTHSFLIKQSTVHSVVAAINVLTYISEAILESHEEYKRAMEHLLSLTDAGIVVLGSELQEENVWQLIIEARATLDSTKNKMLKLETQMVSVANLINAAAEAAFACGAENVAIIANENLVSVQHKIKWSKEKLADLEKEVLLKQTEHIAATTSAYKEDSDEIT